MRKKTEVKVKRQKNELFFRVLGARAAPHSFFMVPLTALVVKIILYAGQILLVGEK